MIDNEFAIPLKQQLCDKCGGSFMYLTLFKNTWDMSFDPFTDELTCIPVEHIAVVWVCRACDRTYQFSDYDSEICDISDLVRSVKKVE